MVEGLDYRIPLVADLPEGRSDLVPGKQPLARSAPVGLFNLIQTATMT